MSDIWVIRPPVPGSKPTKNFRPAQLPPTQSTRLSKNVGRHDRPVTKNKNKYWLKRLKVVSKNKLWTKI